MSDSPDASRLDVALKEWEVAIDALATGKQIVLLRKGGIHERGGEFRLEHDRFALFPTREHQKLELLKPEVRARAESLPPEDETSPVCFRAYAELVSAFPLEDAMSAYHLVDEFIWNEDYVRMRVEYKPDRPLFVLLLRVFRLREEISIERHPRYAGCRSWVTLEGSIDGSLGEVAIGDDEFAGRLSRIRAICA